MSLECSGCKTEVKDGAHYCHRCGQRLILSGEPPEAIKDASSILQTAMAELEAMIGMKYVKDTVRRLEAALARERVLGRNQSLTPHFVFTGNAGTGKTTVAQLMARIFHGMGLLPTDRVIEVCRADLVSDYLGQTAELTNRAIDNAIGGVLFIDEAYALITSDQDRFGQEAVTTLIMRMEEDRGKFVVIAAGYSREMQVFLDANSGLRSRFTDTVEFADYNGTDMHCIFQRMCEDLGLSIDKDFDEALADYLDQMFASRDENFGNGRDVRKLFDQVISACADRVKSLNLPESEQEAAYRKLTLADLNDAMKQMEKSR